MRRPTISDIAARAGVSTGAVSYALNGRPGVSAATRARILAVAAEMGWRPSAAARALSASRADAIGLVLARETDTLGVEPFFARFIAGLQKTLSVRGSALLLQVVPRPRDAVEALRGWWEERRVDGVILTDLWTDDPRLAAVSAMGVPAVLVGRPRANWPFPAVWSDDGRGVDEAVDHLVAQGHRRLGRVSGPAGLDHTRVRGAALTAAATRHGLPEPVAVETDYTWEAGARATERLLTGTARPTAILYDNDIMAVAGLTVARRLGVAVPERLSLVAGDDSQLCEIGYPPLTALSRDVHEYGVAAARTLEILIDTGAAPHLEAGTPRLRVRDSTAPPRRGRARTKGGTGS
ncbi:LacI family transcriptional regulator [Actinocorallia sp. API 0066]|uniref:LacI family DNA-binding transcriptional regulator n=1 Tax=Actinocorallia sp. API 0066 TaxID=2896846 RepID=UPI001E2DEF1D|nr:LacI family DNA-binding transcriptional regulator [Actinocorallia sp. API 0066]MCD0449226.1 LacI family transcriptional regulator [Actinocorallia sp. API 0066]